MSSDAATPWVEGLTIGQTLVRTARAFPAHDALVFPALGKRWSFAEFLAEVDQAARGLLALGIRPGQHVAIWATNVPQWVILQFATARIGAVLVTINPAYRPFELEYVLRQSDAVALFLVDRFKSSDYFAMLAEVCPELAGSRAGHSWPATDFPRLRWVVALKGDTPAGAISWNEMLDRGANRPLISTSLGEQLVAAGADQHPVHLRHDRLSQGGHAEPSQPAVNAYYVGGCQRMSEHDRICIPVPFYHCFGCVLANMCSIVYGAAMIVPAESFDPGATLDAIERERATVLYGVPTMFIAQLQHDSFGSRDLSSLRTGIMSGSPCPIEVMRQVVDRDGRPRNHDRLRPDRSLARHHADR